MKYEVSIAFIVDAVDEDVAITKFRSKVAKADLDDFNVEETDEDGE